jgi:hypothetical protein
VLDIKPGGLLERAVAFLVGLAMISLGVTSYLRSGSIFYTNWFGELVFTPLAVFAGLFTLYCSLFKPEWLTAQCGHNKRSRK